MRLSDGFARYKQDVIIFRNQSAKTEETHDYVAKALIKFLGDKLITELSFEDVRKWKIHLSKDRSPSTVRGYIIRVRVVLAYLRLIGIDCLNPELVGVPKRTDKVPEFISKEEVVKLIAGTNIIRNKAIISLLYGSGIRVSECCNLNIGDIRDNSFTVVGKGGKARLCFIDERTQLLLDLYLDSRSDNNPALFTGKYDSHRITPGNIQEIFRFTRKSAGFTSQIHPHTLRHSFATNLMINGMHIYGIQKLLGHASIQTTQMYLHVVDPHLQADYAKYHTV